MSLGFIITTISVGSDKWWYVLDNIKMVSHYESGVLVILPSHISMISSHAYLLFVLHTCSSRLILMFQIFGVRGFKLSKTAVVLFVALTILWCKCSFIFCNYFCLFVFCWDAFLKELLRSKPSPVWMTAAAFRSRFYLNEKLMNPTYDWYSLHPEIDRVAAIDRFVISKFWLESFNITLIHRSTRLGWISIDSIDRFDRFRGLVFLVPSFLDNGCNVLIGLSWALLVSKMFLLWVVFDCFFAK